MSERIVSQITENGLFRPNQEDVNSTLFPDYNSPGFSGSLDVHLNEMARAFLPQTDTWRHSLRSANAQGGIRALIDFENRNIQGDNISVPLDLISLLDVGFMDPMRDLIKNGRLKVGRIILLAENPFLEKTVIENLYKDHHIMLPKNTDFLADGTLLVPICDMHSTELLLDNRLVGPHAKEQLDDPESYLKDVLLHGRKAITRIQYQKEIHRESSIEPTELRVLQTPGIALGPYNGIIEGVYVNGKLREDIEHSEAFLLDGGRTNGRKNPRQWELYNAGEENIRFEDIKVALKLFPPTKEIQQFWNGLSLEQESRILEEGVRISDALGTKGLVDSLENTPQHPSGKVLSESGRTQVPDITHPTLLEEYTKRGTRHHDPHAKDMRLAGHKGRLLVTERLPQEYLMEKICNPEGIGAIAFKSSPDGNQYLTTALHQGMLSLQERHGTEFLWNPEGLDDVRNFQSGFFMKPEEESRFFDPRYIMAGYGSHKKELDKEIEPIASNIVKNLIEVFGGPEYFGSAHGCGPGVMMAVDNATQANGSPTYGVGIGVEKVGQKLNFNPTFMTSFEDLDRHYRQAVMEVIQFFRTYFLGGGGTLEEFGTGICNTKLGLVLPTPNFLFDPSTEKDHYYEGFERALKSMTERQIFTIEGRKVDLKDVRLLQPWVKKFFIPVRSEEEIITHMKTFLEDPQQQWADAGVTSNEIKMALETDTKNRLTFGQRLPDEILKQALAFAGVSNLSALYEDQWTEAMAQRFPGL